LTAYCNKFDNPLIIDFSDMTLKVFDVYDYI